LEQLTVGVFGAFVSNIYIPVLHNN